MQALLAWAVFWSAAAQDYDFMKRGRSCPSHKCGGGSEAVPKQPMRLESPGCSGMAGMQMFSASKRDDVAAPCCDQRHACFGICGASKAQCETQFKACTDATCAAKAGGDKEECDKAVGMHTLMADLGDCRPFAEAQAKACDCVPAAKAARRRQQSLNDFYTKFDPQGVDKVAALAAKADSAKKLASLFSKLTAKFPKSIKQFKDPQAAWMEDLMKKSGEEKGAAPAATVVEETGAVDDDVVDLDAQQDL
ncbi:hypothetical protein M885DRAFT_541690 [Pelagophyceae sp. CCMP2097]|nr:hypothetical protein M885DRAFT_541690 [Pelagophyceae sp. CCMP2097]|mmetsp:Transcript_23866/g.82534  ORF Transcript_23866/g.82534 Transcript_23866/m.82534 type:complete len:250 (+) Transcript_23866:51-800(+)